MKKLVVLTLLCSVFIVLHAQSYTIRFSATGAGTTLDSVYVENITKGVSVTLRGDFTLILSKSVGVNERNSLEFSDICVYPNPVKGSCRFDFNALKPGNTLIALYDLSGKHIVSHQEDLTAGRQYWHLNGLNKGLYLLKVSSDSYFYSAKVQSLENASGKVTMVHESLNPEFNEKSQVSGIQSSPERKSGATEYSLAYETGDAVVMVGFTYGYSIHYTVDPPSTPEVIFELYPCIDSRGYKYPLTKIGSQLWMAENLKVTTFNNGIPIPEVKNNAEWTVLTTCARCWWQNDSATYARDYGALYNQFCVNSIVCPAGYRVPNNSDWDQLVNFLGGASVAGGFLKSRGTSYWLAPNTGATNKAGFNAHGGSARSVIDGGFPAFKQMGFWWTYEEYEFREMSYDSGGFAGGGFSPRENGMAIRCIKN